MIQCHQKISVHDFWTVWGFIQILTNICPSLLYLCTPISVKYILHAVPSYKKRLYKKLLVDFCRHKKRRLVDILSAKKPYHKFLQFFPTIMLFFSKIFKLFIWNGHFFKNFKKQRLYKAEKLRNKVCIKLAKRWETQLVGIELCFL